MSQIRKTAKPSIKDNIVEIFKKEALRFDWDKVDFKTFESENQPKLNCSPAELLLKAGLFKLLESNSMAHSHQWIFYNGLLLSSPSNHLEKENRGETREKSGELYTKNPRLSLSIPKLSAETIAIYLIYIQDSSLVAYHTVPKISILAEEGASASITECYVNLGSKPHFVQSETDITLKPGSKVDHVVLIQNQGQNEDEHLDSAETIVCKRGLQTLTLKVLQDSLSEYRGFLTSVGSALFKANASLEFRGEKACSEFGFLMNLKHTEYAHIDVGVHHGQPDCKSKILGRAVVEDKARFELIGKIKVDAHAEGSDACLENKNLLLSNLASAHAEPELEIYNGNIQCRHGATVGHLDENALFYLQSRGIPRADAIQMLIQAFLQPVTLNIPNAGLRNLLEK